jgi:hypothetical protein
MLSALPATIGRSGDVKETNWGDPSLRSGLL